MWLRNFQTKGKESKSYQNKKTLKSKNKNEKKVTTQDDLTHGKQGKDKVHKVFFAKLFNLSDYKQ